MQPNNVFNILLISDVLKRLWQQFLWHFLLAFLQKAVFCLSSAADGISKMRRNIILFSTAKEQPRRSAGKDDDNNNNNSCGKEVVVISSARQQQTKSVSFPLELHYEWILFASRDTLAKMAQFSRPPAAARFSCPLKKGVFFLADKRLETIRVCD
jgi:hypothetical protein